MPIYTSLAPETGTTAALIADLYEAAGALRRCGEQMAASTGQTHARWQLLSVVQEGQWTVAHAARRLGLSRQAVQRVARDLLAEGLLVAETNPNHVSSPLIRLTDPGRRALDQIVEQADSWRERVDADLDPADVAAAERVLRVLVGASRGPGD